MKKGERKLCSHEERQETRRNTDLAKVVGLLAFLDIRKVSDKAIL